MRFNNLGLTNALLTAITEQGYQDPSAIQREAIPAILAHKDVTTIAQTGTGKTAGFSLPVLQLLAGQKSSQAYPRAYYHANT